MSSDPSIAAEETKRITRRHFILSKAKGLVLGVYLTAAALKLPAWNHASLGSSSNCVEPTLHPRHRRAGFNRASVEPSESV